VKRLVLLALKHVGGFALDVAYGREPDEECCPGINSRHGRADLDVDVEAGTIVVSVDGDPDEAVAITEALWECCGYGWNQ
jgi:hypothetical protein